MNTSRAGRAVVVFVLAAIIAGLLPATAAAVEPEIGPPPTATCPAGTPGLYPPNHAFCLRSSEYAHLQVDVAEAGTGDSFTMTVSNDKAQCVLSTDRDCVERILWNPYELFGVGYRLVRQDGTWFGSAGNASTPRFATVVFGTTRPAGYGYYQPFWTDVTSGCHGPDGLPVPQCTIAIRPLSYVSPASWVVLTPWIRVRLPGDPAQPKVTREEPIEAAFRFLAQPPEASFTWDAAADDPLTLSFDASASTDDTGIDRYVWDFGDDDVDGEGVSPTHTFEAPGTYRVRLIVFDVEGHAAFATEDVVVRGVSVTVGAVPPQAEGVRRGEPIDYTIDAEAIGVASSLGVTATVRSDLVDVDPASISAGGVLSGDGSTIDWTFAGVEGTDPPLSFSATVRDDAPATILFIPLDVTARATLGSGETSVSTTKLVPLLASRSITIVHETIPAADEQDFTFAGTAPIGQLVLDTDPGSTEPSQRTVADLDEGTYNLTASTPSGWALESVTCNDPTGGTTTDPTAGSVSIELSDTDAVTCTFVSKRALVGLVVNSPRDFGDEDPTDGACDTGVTITRGEDDEPECTLRAAMEQANFAAGLDTIEFDVPGGPATIRPGSPLPVVGQPLTIDGSTQPGTTIDGAAAGAGADGLAIGAAATVRGLRITAFDGAGVHALGAGEGSIVLVGNVIGAGQPGAPGNRVGVRWENTLDRIGGNGASDGNVISGNRFAGVWMSRYGTLAGNRIGTDATGAVAIPNGVGVLVDDLQEIAIRDNVISGNDRWGLRIEPLAPETVDALAAITGNLIGLAADGSTPLGNGSAPGEGLQSGGMWVGAPITIGAVADGNVISGNTSQPDADGAAAAVVLASDRAGLRFIGNRVGTDADGASAIANGGAGILVDCRDCAIGETGAANLISGNAGAGMMLRHHAGSAVVASNLIGLDAAGAVAIPNGSGGLVVELGVHCLDPRAIRSNVISGNTGFGVRFYRPLAQSISCAVSPAFSGNIVGLDASGLAAVPNTGPGLWIDGDDQELDFAIGVLDAPPNTVSGNLGDGILIAGAGASGTVRDAFVGTTSTGDCAAECPGNGGSGIVLTGIEGTYDPRSGVETRHVRIVANVIAGNNLDGILAVRSTGVHVDRNAVGATGSASADFGNGRDGIRFDGGGGVVGENRLFHNRGSGVAVTNFGSVQMFLNEFFANRGLAIDLAADGPTPNDLNDLDDGPNHLLNAPVIERAAVTDGGLAIEVEGRLDAPTGRYYLEVFGYGAAPAFAGCGRSRIGTIEVTTDLTTSARFLAVLPLPGGVDVSRIAATTNGDPRIGDILPVPAEASELSACVAVAAAPPETTLVAASAPGATRVEVESSTGFVGSVVEIGSGATAERNLVVATGSLVLAMPLRFAHEAGEPVVVVDDTLFVSVERSTISRAGKRSVATFAGSVLAAQGAEIACGDAVALVLGDALSVAIPGSEFVTDAEGRCRYALESRTGATRFELDPIAGTWSASVVRPSLVGLENPLRVELSIGDDSGADVVAYAVKSARWTYRRA